MKQFSKKVTYSDVGVDTRIEAKGAQILYEAARSTWENRKGLLGEVVASHNDFSGTRFVRVDNLPSGTVIYGGSDGIATKAAIAEEAGMYSTLAFDLMAMVCDDAAIRGGEPVLVKSVLDVNTLGKDTSRLKYLEKLAKGYVAAAKEAKVAIINGELAQLNDRAVNTSKFSLSWSADVTWFAHESRLLSGSAVRVGDYLVGLKEPGVRCNGISLIRHVLHGALGKNWADKKLNGHKLSQLALAPSRIYSPAIVAMTGGYDLEIKPRAVLHAAAHITGGGLPEKLGRSLKPSGFGADINEPFEPSPLFTYCQKLGGISDAEAYSTWNMGQGMVLATPSFSEVIKTAKKWGIEAKVIGTVTKEPGIRVLSKGAHTPRKYMRFN